MYTVGSLFTGVGMFDLGFAWAGFRVRWQVEFDAWCQELLRARGNIFDHPTIYGDVRSVGAGRQHEPGYADVLIGGFPCQPFSLAGKRKGADDNRNMWPEFGRIIGDVRPRAVVLENVPAICNPITAADGSQQPAYALTVVGDLSEMGYDARWAIIRASDTGAFHGRPRWWLVAYRDSGGQRQSDNNGRRLHNRERYAAFQSAGWQGQSIPTVSSGQSDELMAYAYGIGHHEPQAKQDSSADTHGIMAARQQQRPAVAYAAFAGRQTHKQSRRMDKPRLVGIPDGLAYRLDEPRYPAGMGSEQHDYEPPRTAPKTPHQRERTKALGNGLSPQIAYALAVGVRAELERRDREEQTR